MDRVPFISIGIASYNYEKYIIRELEAIKRQKFKDYEVIICDDCSSDNSIQIIEQFITNNPNMRIKLFRNQKNMGILKTKNRLIEESNGIYLMICDSDDWMSDNCLEILAKAAEKDDPDRVIAEVYDVDESGKIIQIQDLPQNPSKWMNTIHHGTIYRRKIFIENNISFKCEPDDAYIILKFNQYCNKVSFIHEPIYYWYVHNNSEGRKKKTYQIEKTINHFSNIVNFVNDTILFLEKESKSKTIEDIELVRLLLLKLYYNQIFNGLRHMKLGDMVKAYFKLRNVMRDYNANYLSNKYLKNEREAPIRKYAFRIIKISTILERLHIMSLGLCVYKILSNFIYFDQ